MREHPMVEADDACSKAERSSQPAPSHLEQSGVRARRLIASLLILAGMASALVAFADRDGYEGDDLSFISGVLQLDEAKRGELSLYRYAWQPISYELASWVYHCFDTSDAVFLMAPIACSVAFAVLLFAMARTSRNVKTPWAHLAILVLLPELFYCGLYLNTTAFAMPAAAAAVALLLAYPGRGGFGRPAAIGLALGLAGLLRFDFILMVPFFAASLWVESRSIRPIVSLGAGALAFVVVAIAAGFFRPMELIETFRVHQSEVNAATSGYYWTWKQSLQVVAVVMHPVAWVVFLLGLPMLIRDHAKRHGAAATALVAFSLLPLFLPLTAFTTAKYAIPLVLLLPFTLLSILDRWCERRSASTLRALHLAITAVAVFALLVSVEPSKRPPYVRITTTRPRPIATHDGARSLGAYLVSMGKVSRQDPSDLEWRAAHAIFDALVSEKPVDVWFVGADDSYVPGRVGWRYTRILLARAGVLGRCIARETDRYGIGKSRITFTIPPKNGGEGPFAPDPGATIIDLSPSGLTGVDVLARVERALTDRH